eukprot:TRINITY_DN7016_c0_g2_i1.p3 TRINITY_DN7016_c0_g2~~TRINITY_DN7016_c0_g2_i1.p3  ORF type:complete len:154 (+),score=22.06 TRINITY_DN7016_c0_g2_i1:162-623(+)
MDSPRAKRDMARRAKRGTAPRDVEVLSPREWRQAGYGAVSRRRWIEEIERENLQIHNKIKCIKHRKGEYHSSKMQPPRCAHSNTQSRARLAARRIEKENELMHRRLKGIRGTFRPKHKNTRAAVQPWEGALPSIQRANQGSFRKLRIGADFVF